jgi:hypothetical protein
MQGAGIVDTRPQGIKGLQGREPVGAAVTIGVKDKARGFPTGTDRWYIVKPREESGVRHLHPGFTNFNNAPPDKRQVLRGNIIHATEAECFEYQLKAQVIKKPAHPDKKPMCVGDGIKAIRWEGGDPDDFFEIKCPNERCEYRQSTPPKCKPFARLLFKLRWQDGINLPTPLVKYTTGSWNTTANLKGFFDHIHKQANQMGLETYTLFGFPFIMTLQYQTKASAQSRFPVVHISPEMEPVDFFRWQRSNIAKLQAEHIVALPDLQEPGELLEDVESISVPSTGGK